MDRQPTDRQTMDRLIDTHIGAEDAGDLAVVLRAAAALKNETP